MSVEIQRTEVVLNNRGARGTSGSVLVSSATGQAVSSRMGLAAISSPSAGQVAFLTETAREGMFAFDSSDLTAAVGADPAQAIYVAPASATSGISGAWVRRYNGAANAKWFGAVGDGTTNDATALQRWLDHGDKLSLPAGKYYSAADLILRQSAVIEGDGYGFDNRIVDGSATQGYDNQPGSRIAFAAGKGFQVQPQTTQTDETTTIVVSQEGAAYSRISNLALVGAGTGATVAGIYCRTVIHLENVQVLKFTGKGFDISAAGGPGADPTAEYGNSSISSLTNCHAISNGSHGFHIRGTDANVVRLTTCNAITNGGWGFLDEGELGNNYNGCHASTNTSGSYKCISGVANSTYNGCYVEPGTGQAPDISYRCTVNGSLLADLCISSNVATNGNPTIIGASGLRTGLIALPTSQPTAGAITDRCLMYRHADEGLVLQGVPEIGGTYTHAFRNQADEAVLLLQKTTKALYIQGPLVIGGIQVVGPQLPAVAGAAHSVGVPTFAEFNALVDVVNTIIARDRAHGLIAT